MRKFLFCVLIVTCFVTHGQVVPNIDWIKNFSADPQVRNIPTALDASGNVYVTGSSVVNGSPEVTTVKYNSAGVLQWFRHYNNGGTDVGKDIGVDPAGNVYVVGSSDGAGTGSDIVLIKYDANGAQQWAARYNGAGNSNDSASALVLASNSLYITGSSTGAGTGFDFFTLKYNTAGAQQWLNTYNGTGNGADIANNLALANGNRLFVTGKSTTSNGFDFTTLAINSSNGSQLWVKSLNGTGNANDEGLDLVADGSDVIVTGYVNNTCTQDDYCAVKYSGTNGSVSWTAQYDGFGANDQASSLVRDGVGNFAITGLVKNGTADEYHTLLYNGSGAFQWVNKVAVGISVATPFPKIATDNIANHFYVCGGISTNFGDVLVYQVTPGGNKTWQVTRDGALGGDDAGVNLAVDNSGVIYVTARTHSSGALYDYTTIKISQTPYYAPIDFANEPNDPTSPYHENIGQVVDPNYQQVNSIKYYTTNQVPNVYVQPTSMSFLFSKLDSIPSTDDSLHRIDMTFPESNLLTTTNGYEALSAYTNFYLGFLPAPALNVRGFQRLITPNIYPNIDLHYYNNRDGLKYYFVVKPGGNPAAIKALFSGASSTGINGTQLKINSTLGMLTFDAPITYQVNFGQQIMQLNGTASWQQLATNTYGFNLPSYNQALPLVIEVKKAVISASTFANQLCWSTYYGGSDYESGHAIDVDANGIVHLTGQTSSPNFPQQGGPGVFTSNFGAGFYGAFYAQFNSNNALNYTLVYGGNRYTLALDVKVKNANEVLLCGRSNSTNLTFLNPGGGAHFQTAYTGSSSLEQPILLRFDLSTGGLTYATFVNTSGKSGTAAAMDFDSNGNLYFVGRGSAIIQNQSGAFNSTIGAGFIVKLDNVYNLKWGTTFGNTTPTACRVDPANNLWVFGETQSAALPALQVTGGFFDGTLGGATDHFAAKFNTLNAQIWTSYIGGTGDESLHQGTLHTNAIAFNGNLVYFTGSTQSADFPLVNPGGGAFFDNSLSTSPFSIGTIGDGYLIELDRTTLVQNWGTLISGDGHSDLYAVEVDASGNVFVAGSTNDHTFPLTSSPGAYYQTAYSTTSPIYNEMGILFSFRNRLLQWATLFGGNNDYADGNAIFDLKAATVSGSQVLYASGFTSTHNDISFDPNSLSPPFPLYAPSGAYFDNSYNGLGSDAFIAEFCTSSAFGIGNFSQHNNNVALYPNPTTGKIIIPFNNQGNSCNISIYNIAGQQIFSSQKYPVNSEIELDVTLFDAGVYIVKITGNNGIYTGRFIKE